MTSSFPAADIKAQIKDDDLKVQHSYSVVTPEKDKNDFMITIRASEIRGWRAKLTTLTKNKFPYAEVLLAASSLGFGAILSALLSNTSLQTGMGKFFFVFLPPVTAALTVAYLFVRKGENASAASVANTLLTEMPNMKTNGDS